MSQRNQPCPQCGAPLDDDGYCRYHQGSRAEVPVTVSPAETYFIVKPTPRLIPEALLPVALVLFMISVFYVFLGNTLELYEIGELTNLVMLLVKAVTAWIIAIYNFERNKVLLSVLFSINAVLGTLVFVLNLIG
ncbi:hypothetical protein C4561_00160 [candidate division WWE3 bacterium]|jgi:hypothetical protein|uniref:Uncharacterized protein n=1 Tax=candidate division WWE3 bacterium TaxID=2053526 RepID=A0A3A4ZGM8_UNCKA|nr:MAG: hypothetical protein C4561_00160 [candidate division WWE3 bacterium]